MTNARLEIFVPFKPVPKQSARFRAIPGEPGQRPKIRSYTDSRVKSFQRTVAAAAKAACEAQGWTMTTRVPLLAYATISRPLQQKHRTRKGLAAFESLELYPVERPDADNGVKGLLDGMSGIVYSDDANAVTLIVNKEFVLGPAGVRIVIVPMTPAVKTRLLDFLSTL